jgi:Tfp pilus assembly protein PilO
MSRRLLAFGFGAVALLLAVWFLLLWGPQGTKLSDAKKRTTAAESQNSELQLRLSRLQAAQKGAPELMAKGEELRRAIPATPDLAQFILDANDAATAAGVDFLSISPSPPVPPLGAGPAEVHLQIAVTGSYTEVINYLDRLDDLPRLVVVDTLGLTPGGGDSASPDDLSVAITARMFTTAVPASTTTGSGATGATTTTPGGSTTTTAPGATTTSTAPTTTAASRG